jgi:hypothetical protein
MQKQHTAESRSPQVSSRTSADNTRPELARQKFRFLAAVKFKLSSDTKTCEVSHRLLADLADEIVTGPYPSLAAFAPIYASQKADRSRETGHSWSLSSGLLRRAKGPPRPSENHAWSICNARHHRWPMIGYGRRS